MHQKRVVCENDQVLVWKNNVNFLFSQFTEKNLTLLYKIIVGIFCSKLNINSSPSSINTYF